MPKVLSTPFKAQVITLSAFRPETPTGTEPINTLLLCPVHVVRTYIEHSRQFRLLEQLFVCFGGRTKGLPVSKQRLSHWIVNAIALAYSSEGVECPIGVRAHSTRGLARVCLSKCHIYSGHLYGGRLVVTQHFRKVL